MDEFWQQQQEEAEQDDSEMMFYYQVTLQRNLNKEQQNGNQASTAQESKTPSRYCRAQRSRENLLFLIDGLRAGRESRADRHGARQR